MLHFDVNLFIKERITLRSQSMFLPDLIRNQKQLEKEINGKKVLVIGGAGTIGSAFIKSILTFSPSSLTVVDQNENDLTELTRDLRASMAEFIPGEYLTYPFNFGGSVFSKLMDEKSFDIIACFAAHKHVRSEKDHLSIEAMIINNVFNIKKLLELSLRHKPNHFFCVSTDKAANPVNVMGASKKVMEKILLSYSSDIKITTARFANVAFSNGSLLFGFLQRILKRQPISAPVNVKRYFVSPEESGQFCLLTCILGKSGDIFFPKLKTSQMVSFATIAEQFLATLGLKALHCETAEAARIKAKKWSNDKKQYPVHFFQSDTSGEKLYEEFYTESDEINLDTFQSIGIIKKSEMLDQQQVEAMMKQLEKIFLLENTDKKNIIQLLKRILPAFNHIETGKSLDERM